MYVCSLLVQDVVKNLTEQLKRFVLEAARSM